MAAARYTVDERPAWTICVCECGFPLGARYAAERLGVCPDCGRATAGAASVVVVQADDGWALWLAEPDARRPATGRPADG